MQQTKCLQKLKLHDITKAQAWFYSTEYIEQGFAFSSALDKPSHSELNSNRCVHTAPVHARLVFSYPWSMENCLENEDSMSWDQLVKHVSLGNRSNKASALEVQPWSPKRHQVSLQ